MMGQLGVPALVIRNAVGHMSDAMARHYTHISDNVAGGAVEKLDQLSNTPRFVNVFVDVPQETALRSSNGQPRRSSPLSQKQIESIKVRITALEHESVEL